MLLPIVQSQEKMEKKFERRSEGTDLFLPLLVAEKNCSIFNFSFWQFLVAWKNAIAVVRE